MLIKNNILDKRSLLYKGLKEYKEIIIIILATIVTFPGLLLGSGKSMMPIIM